MVYPRLGVRSHTESECLLDGFPWMLLDLIIVGSLQPSGGSLCSPLAAGWGGGGDAGCRVPRSASCSCPALPSVDGTPQDCCRNKFCGAAPGTASSRPKAQLAARARRKQENLLLWGPGVMSGGGSSRTGWVFCMKGACSARPSSVLE